MGGEVGDEQRADAPPHPLGLDEEPVERDLVRGDR
jgi:hypothetical protein